MQENADHDNPEKTKLLWHYTSLDVLSKILKTGIMRATHHSFLNDSEEVVKGCKIIYDELKTNYADCAESVWFIRLCSFLERISQNGDPKYPFIISFSEEGDLLSQWQGYTDNQIGGCAIGFCAMQVEKLFFNPNERNESAFIPRLVACEYDIDNWKTKLAQIKAKYGTDNEYLNFENHPVPDAASKAIAKSLRMQMVPAAATSEFFQLAYSLKHPCFKPESEYRIVCKSDDKHPVKYDLNKPYIECKFNNELFPNAIKEIKISPHGNKGRAIEFINFLLQDLGFSNIRVSNSELPFIGKR